MSDLNRTYVYDSVNAKTFERNILRNVFVWMSLGLATTGVVAYINVLMPSLILAKMQGFGMFGLGLAQIAIVMVLSFNIHKMSSMQAVGAFLLYAVTMGVTIAFYAMVFGATTVFKAFFITSAMFAVTSITGYVTKSDLASFGSFLRMALWGLLITALVNMFLKSPVLDYIYSIAGVIIFTGLSIYDVNKIKQMSNQMGSNIDSTSYMRLSIMGALQLYLDFINILLFVIRLLGNSNRD